MLSWTPATTSSQQTDPQQYHRHRTHPQQRLHQRCLLEHRANSQPDDNRYQPTTTLQVTPRLYTVTMSQTSGISPQTLRRMTGLGQLAQSHKHHTRPPPIPLNSPMHHLHHHHPIHHLHHHHQLTHHHSQRQHQHRHTHHTANNHHQIGHPPTKRSNKLSEASIEVRRMATTG
jgi:hypothetical protein